MTTLNKEAPERQDIEALLPWHAAGTLSRRDAERVEQALASDRELARRYDLVREELSETIHLNESLGAPSARAMKKLFAAIEAESPVVKKSSLDFTSRVVEFMSSFSPRTLAWSATGAALAIVLQAAVLTTVVVRDQSGQDFSLASAGSSSTTGAQLAVIRFKPQARFDEITSFLTLHNAVMVGGPKRGGLYDIQISPTPLSKPELEKNIRDLKAETRLVDFVATKE
jgi:anti-sigma-K factor RskA